MLENKGFFNGQNQKITVYRYFPSKKDDISFERIINVPKRGIGDASLDTFRSEKILNDVSYFDYIKNIDNYETELKSRGTKWFVQEIVG